MARTLIKEIKDSRKNYIINGGFDYWQRNTTQTSSGYGSDDRWVNGHSGSTKTSSRQSFTLGQTDVPDNPKYYSRTIVSSVAGSTNHCEKYQAIEDVTRLAGKTVTLSFYAKADSSKNIAVEFFQIFGSGGSPSASVYGIGITTIALTTSWQKFTVTTTMPSVAGKTLGTDNNHFSAVDFWFDAGSNFDSRTNSLGQQSGTFDIAQVMLNEGSTTAPFQLAGETLESELRLCQRYFSKSFNPDYVPNVSFNNWHNWLIVNSSGVPNGGQLEVFWNFPVAMLRAPTVTLWGGESVGGAGQIWVNGTARSAVPDRVSATGVTRITNTSGVTWNAQHLVLLNWTADAEL